MEGRLVMSKSGNKFVAQTLLFIIHFGLEINNSTEQTKPLSLHCSMLSSFIVHLKIILMMNGSKLGKNTIKQLFRSEKSELISRGWKLIDLLLKPNN